MPYIKLMNFRLGIRPSMNSAFDMEKLTGTQKLQLVSSRIFGNSFGGNMRNGTQALRKNFAEEGRINSYDTPIWNPKLMFRYIGDKEEEEEEFEREMERSRLLRIMMRGVKIGKKKGQDKISIMSIYERKKGAGV